MLSQASEASGCVNVFAFESIWMKTQKQTRRKQGTKAILYLSSSPAPRGLFSLSAAACWDTIVRGERNQVEKPRSLPQHDKQMTLSCETLSSAQFIQMKRSSVPYQLTPFNQTLSTPSIIHPVCDSHLACSFLFFFKDVSTVVLLRGHGSCCCPHQHHHHHHRSVQLA